MLLDNRGNSKDFKNYEFSKVVDFIQSNTKEGELELVTGYFSIHALAWLLDNMNQVNRFRMILGSMMREEQSEDRILDLLKGDLDVLSTLSLSTSAKKAVEFLQLEKVLVKSIQKNFCHAKAYIYTDENKIQNYYIVGSSNLTAAGLGIKESSNIELNIAKHDYEHEFEHLKGWFNDLWDTVASDKIKLSDKTEIEVKQHIIELIQKLYKEYTPFDLYYKVLYEMFKEDLMEFSGNEEFKREIAHLEETIIFKTLYPYQQKGAISLIKMLHKYNGAILADAVGLGKTWTALAVMKYYELKGYTVLLLCPKKLSNNWQQYRVGQQSRFEKDEIDFYIRYHTDLQEGRFDRYNDKTLRFFQTRPKLMIVIDESHNLRNDKSSRYKFLVEKILFPENPNRDVKVLHLSATPINNKLMDIRNQFKLMTKGMDDGFKNTDLEIDSLENIFRLAQQDFSEWAASDNRKIADFIAKLPRKFEKLTDALIVSRTRKMIEDEFGEMNFPQKDQPINEFIELKNIGELKSFDDILDAITINLTAYRPADYIHNIQPKSVLEDEQQRQKFLVKMMYILLIKRLESSWFSFKITVENILNHHINALSKVKEFIELQKDNALMDDVSEEWMEEIDETAAEVSAETEQSITLGKKNPVPLSLITDIELFKKHLEIDIEKLSKLKTNLDKYETDFKNNQAEDEKLNKLIEHITHKQQNSDNKKVLVFTVFKDTAKFLYDELKKRGILNIAFVSGTVSETFDGYSGNNFEPILERFAPFTKLYNEKDWTELYQTHLGFLSDFYEDGRWLVPYEKWLEIIKEHDQQTFYKIENPIDVLIATDCLSEGQNLQDCDMVINYDIHWNPVRLIQRFGRIDRLGSPNKIIKGINFWPSKDYEDYLKLKSRVEMRLALMTLAGTEVNEQLTPELERIVEDNPLLPKQAQKMLEQLKITWDDVETSEQTLGLNDLSLEQFRQELFEFLKKNEEFFKKIPNGVFTGFKLNGNWSFLSDSLVAALGYPAKTTDSEDHVYKEIYLLYQSLETDANHFIKLNNHHEILTMLRDHKNEERYVPREIEQCDKEVLEKLAAAIKNWLSAQAHTTATHEISDLFSGNLSPEVFSNQTHLEEKFKAENFDLINWFIISKP